MFQLSEALKDSGIELEFWGMNDEKNVVSDSYQSFARNVNYKETSFLKTISSTQRTIYSFENRKKISVILDRFQPDLVHLHNYNFQLTPAILPEIKKRGIKIVQTIHDSQMVCPYHRLYNFQKDTICTKCVKGSFFNCISDKCFDGSFFKSLIGTSESFLYHGMNYYEKYIDQFISPSRFLADLIRNKVKNKPIEILPNFSDKIEDLKSVKGNYYLYFGRISSEKGILELVDIFKDLKFNLVIIGHGDQEDQLKKKTENIKNINFLGSRKGRELFSYVSGAKFVIQPSKGYENCPMTVVESFAYGIPVIAANHSGFKDLMEHKKTGYLLNFNDSNKVKEQFLKIDRLKTGRLAKNSFNFYQNHLSKENHISKIIEIYHSVLKE
jgi:glycosyltransferase involved in cell wall biosynthesis